MYIINLTNEPKTVTLRKKGGGIKRVYVSSKNTMQIIERCEATDETLALCKIGAITIKK